MTGQEAAKRNEKAQWLKVWQVDDTWFYVESEDGKIAYKCCLSGEGDYCNCGDFATRSKNDSSFKCKHLLAVMNSIPRNLVMEAQILEKRKPKLDERFIKTIDGKDFALYSGLLDLAHQKNLIGIEVEILQYPMKDNDHTAVCKAIAKTAAGGPYIDVGDANPNNCNAKVARHIIRMASTRAKARCLRDLTNIGMTCLEELGDLTEVIGAEDAAGQTPQQRRDNVRKFNPKQVNTAAAPENGARAKPVNEQVSAGQSDQRKTETTVKPELPAPAPAAPVTETKASPVAAPAPAAPKPPVTRTPARARSGNGEDKSGKIPLMSEAQKSAIYNLSRRRGISVEELENMAQKAYGMSVETLSHENAVSFIRTLQQAA